MTLRVYFFKSDDKTKYLKDLFWYPKMVQNQVQSTQQYFGSEYCYLLNWQPIFYSGFLWFRSKFGRCDDLGINLMGARFKSRANGPVYGNNRAQNWRMMHLNRWFRLVRVFFSGWLGDFWNSIVINFITADNMFRLQKLQFCFDFGYYRAYRGGYGIFSEIRTKGDREMKLSTPMKGENRCGNPRSRNNHR